MSYVFKVGRSVLLGAALMLTLLLLLVGCSSDEQQSSSKQSSSKDAKKESSGEHFSPATMKKADNAVKKIMRNKNLPGVVVAVSSHGNEDYVFAGGDANLEAGRKRHPYDSFRIASITKTFTATAILQLVDEGKLKKTDKLAKWYPNFPNADKITVDDLLRMRSGIADSWDLKFAGKLYDYPLKEVTAEDMIKRSAGKADEFIAPDKETVYTNVNYTLLAGIIEKVSGNSYSTQLEQYIFEPLGMKHTFDPTNSKLPGKLHGYGWNPKKKEFEDKTLMNPDPMKGTGQLISTVTDLEVYGKALATGRLLNPDTQTARLETDPAETQHVVDMTSSAEGYGFEGYGEGIMRWGEFYGHKGDIWGSSSVLFYLPAKDATIVVNVNQMDRDIVKNYSDNVFFAVTRILYPKHVNW